MAVYPPEGETPDQISATRAIYQPTNNVVSFVGKVMIDTKDKLKVETEELSFDQNSGVAHTDVFVSFNRENASGTSMGATVDQKAKRLDLKNNVNLIVSPSGAKTQSRARPVNIKGAHAAFEQQSLQISLTGGVT